MVKFTLSVSLLCTSAFLATPAQARTSVNVLKGEMVLEVSATGISKQKAIKISSICYINADGTTQTGAKQSLDTKIAFMKSKLSTGASFDFSQKPDFIEIGSENEAGATYAAADATTSAASAASASEQSDYERAATPSQEVSIPRFSYKQKIVLSGINNASFELSRKIASDAPCEEVYPQSRSPLIEIADPKGAAQAAIKAAVTNAKQRAQDYATGMNMQVVGLTRIGVGAGIKTFLGDDLASALIQDIRKDILRKRDSETFSFEDVEVTETINAEFVLKPK